MKKLLLAAAVAALSTVAAQAAPTVYGKAFLTVDVQEGDLADTERAQLNSNTSRIGFKGSEALSAQTDLVYQLEYGVDVDVDTNYLDNQQLQRKGQFYSRDTYLGLSNKQFGTVLAGRLTAIDGMVDYANVATGGVLGGDGVLTSFDAPRANNAIAYVSPNYNGLNFLGMYVLDENGGKTDTLGRDGFGVGAKYETNAFNAGGTYIQAGDLKVARVSGSYNVTPAITAGALYQIKDNGNDNKENALTVSGTYKVAQTPWTAYTQVDLVDNYGNQKDLEAQRLVIGGKHDFNKNTTGHVYGAYLKSDDEDAIGVGAGIEYKF